MARRSRLWCGVVLGAAVGLSTGCARDRIHLPPAFYPTDTTTRDTQASAALTVLPATSPAGEPTPETNPDQFNIPKTIPGAQNPAPRSPKDAPLALPELKPVSHSGSEPTTNTAPLTLADLQQLALANNPKIQKAQAEADVVYGQVIQAGLHPNPTVGYQADQVQPNLQVPAGTTGSGAGQQGGYISLLIKTAGKLRLAQQIAGYDYVNALVAVRKAQVEVTAQVRSAYFAAIVARRGAEINRALADMADEVYRLQSKRVAAGLAAAHEPFSFHAQAVQARNAVTQSDAAEAAARKQLAAAVGLPELPVGQLIGQSESLVPSLDPEAIKARLLEQHTDLLMARNQIAQAQTNLTLQKRLPIPDLETNSYHQYDNLAQTYQFGVQLGVQLPFSDRNQGNIRSARARIAVAGQQLRSLETSLLGQLAEANGRYQAQVTIAKNYREQILPDLTQAYRGVVRQYQVDPDKVGFNDIVVAQQNLAQALQAYQSALDAQWKAVVDLAALGQLDDLFPEQLPTR